MNEFQHIINVIYINQYLIIIIPKILKYNVLIIKLINYF